MNLEDITGELLAEPLERFTARRNERTKELKAEGQADLAKQVGGLRKPPVHLWAANQVARQDDRGMRSLNQSAQAVARAQTGGKGARELRSASEQFQKDLDSLVKAAEAVLKKGSHSPTEETLRQIREIFRRAVMNGGEDWRRLEAGALLEEPGPEDNVLSMFQAGRPSAPAKSKESRTDSAAEQRRAAEEKARQLAEERVKELEATAERLRQQAKEAAAEAQRAERRATAAEQQLEEARAEAKKLVRRSAK